MNSALRILLFCLAGLNSVGLIAREQEETVFLFQNRKVTLLVPDGFGFASNKNDRGVITVELADPKDHVKIQVTFLPDPDRRFATPRTQKEFMNETFHDFVGSSVEKAMQFEELEPKVGSGTFCVFTDAKLVGLSTLPRGEFLHSTTGVKTWPGVVAIFTMFSNNTDSKEYRAIMNMLRESVQEKAPPLL
jgi:hypothetical protein